MIKPCKACGEAFNATRNIKHCSDECRNTIDPDLFWAKVNKKGPLHPVLGTRCHLWTASFDPVAGYGWFSVGKRMRNAHTVSLELKLGRPLKLWALHLCDVRLCVRQSHLYEGTPKQNTADRHERGNPSPYRGTKNHAAKLNPKKVRAVRKLLADDVPVQEIARMFDVSSTPIRAIRDGVTWKGVY